MYATWQVTVLFWALLFTKRIFDPNLTTFHLGERVDEVVGSWIVEFVSMQVKLTTLVNRYSSECKVLGLLPDEPREDMRNPLNLKVLLLKPTIPPP